jgi:glucokinase
VTATVGVDVGGTKLLALAVDEEGRTIAHRRVPSAQGFDAVVADVVAAIEGLAAETGAVAACLGIAGMVDPEGTVAFAPNIPGLRAAPVGAALRKRLPIPVLVDNDANVAAVGEAAYGAATGREHVLLVTIGTGIGGGLVLGGRVYRGAHGYGGEIGHFTVDATGPMCACGERGHWEAIASGSALDRMARELVAAGGGHAVVAAAGGDRTAVDGTHVALAAHLGDAEARALLERLADGIALGMAGLCNILDPECVVVSGGLVEMGNLLLDPVRRRLAVHLEGGAFRPEIPVEPAALGERAGAVGAAVLARQLAG